MSVEWTSVKWVKRRILGVAGFLLLLATVIVFRAYQLQIFGNSQVLRLASQQYYVTHPVRPQRGSIYDRNGELLAYDIRVASIGAHPAKIEDRKKIIGALSKHLGLSRAEIEAKLNPAKKFVWMARRVDTGIGDALGQMKLQGITVVPEYRRFYPHKELAGHLLGAVGFDAKALGGLELTYDSYLKSDAASEQTQKDARGRFYSMSEARQTHYDLHLTLDLNLQHIVEKYLREQAQVLHPHHAFAIAMNPGTGEILAMANDPPFNPNAYADIPLAQWKNYAVIDTFEPGSTFKSIVLAAALESGKVKPNERFFCENGVMQIGRRVIRDHKAYGNMSVADIIRVSSNICMAKIAKKVGTKAIAQTLADMGFGKQVPIGLPGEEAGFIKKGSHWTEGDQASLAFGQGLSVNGLQMVSAYATLANGGTRMKPFLVSQIRDNQGHGVLKTEPEALGKIIEAKTAKVLSRMLEGVVSPTGTAPAAMMNGYPVAGKTGTAQKIDPRTKTYDVHNYVSSFIGYVPADRPEYVLYVVYDSPRPLYYGGVVAAPVFRKIALDALAYGGVMPRRDTVAAYGLEDKPLAGNPLGLLHRAASTEYP